jgi:predicted DNA-binding WGR domain protein
MAQTPRPDRDMFDTVSQLEIFPTDLQMRRVDPARNMRRFYRMSIQPDLFGGASLVREWGRIGYRGQMMVEPHADEGQAVTALMKLARAKQRRGYA